jgi:anti-sigma factor RsiW
MLGMADTHDCGGDAAAYVLGGMDATEAEAFRRRLETCPTCRDELVALRHVVDALPMSAPQLRMPKDLRRRVLTEVRGDAASRRRSARRPAWPAAWSRPVLAGIATAALAVAVLAGVELAPSGRSQSSRVYNAAVGSGQLRVVNGRGELVVHRLRVPPPDRIYEVWIERADGTLTPTSSLFSVTAAGTGNAAVPGNLDGAKAVLVTLEPAGGTRVPTTKPVIVTRIS